MLDRFILKPFKRDVSCRQTEVPFSHSLTISIYKFPIHVFDKFVIESKNGVFVLHLEDRFDSFVLL